MGAGQATASHLKEHSSIKDQSSVTNNSAMKSPASLRKNLHVSFTTSDLDKTRAMNDYTRMPAPSSPTSHHSNGISTSGTRRRSRYSSSQRHSGDSKGDVTDGGISNGITPYVPTHLPPSFNRSNNNHLPNTAYRHSQYDNTDSPVPKTSTDSIRSSSSSRRSRARSVSPRRSERIVIPTTLRRSDVENLKIALRSTRSASSSSRKTSSGSSDSSYRNKDSMTSFVIGRPAKFSPAAFGDMGIFKAISSVNESLYICGVMALSEEKIKALKIDCVINATLEWPAYQIRGLETVRVQVDDVPTANLAPYFDRVANKINDVISRGGRVLVHCMAGISRSSSLCIAYLMKYKGLALQQAYSLLKTRRPLIRPNDGFWRQLVQYERELKRQKTQKSTGASHRGAGRTLQQPRASDDNPSMTVTRLASAQNDTAKSSQKTSTVSHAFRPSATGIRQSHDDRKSYTSLSALPATTSIVPMTRSTSIHKLGTLRNSGTMRTHPQRQREIALGALRSGEHWSTTYGNDYSKQFSRR